MKLVFQQQHLQMFGPKVNIMFSNIWVKITHIYVRKLLIAVARYNVNPYSAGIDFNRQNLTSLDVRF